MKRKKIREQITENLPNDIELLDSEKVSAELSLYKVKFIRKQPTSLPFLLVFFFFQIGVALLLIAGGKLVNILLSFFFTSIALTITGIITYFVIIFSRRRQENYYEDKIVCIEKKIQAIQGLQEKGDVKSDVS